MVRDNGSSSRTFDLFRFVFGVRLWYFRRLVRRSLYLPTVVPPVPQGAADRVALIGSTDALRTGVIDDDLSTLSRVANNVRAQRGKAFGWQHTNTQLLTARHAARHPFEELMDVDAAVIVLGFSDVLLMTRPCDFERDLSQLVASVRRAAGEACGVVLTGLAPMNEFRYTARLGRRRIQQQVARINNSLDAVASGTSACIYVPPPTFSRPAGRPGDEQHSWAAIHRLWGQAISPALVTLLDSPIPAEQALPQERRYSVQTENVSAAQV